MLKSEGRFKEFEIRDIFEVKSPPKRFNANSINLDGGYPYVVRTSENNGIKGYTTQDEKYLCEGGTISFGQDTATIFFQEYPYFTGDKIKVMKCRDTKLNSQTASYLLAAMRKSFSSFSWGVSSFNEDVLNSVKIILPVERNGSVDYQYMQHIIECIENDFCLSVNNFLESSGYLDCSLTEEEQQALSDLALGNILMERMKIVDVFNVSNTHNILKSDVVFGSGTTPYVTASESDNSVTSYISYNEDLKESGNTIMIGGKTLVITYQPRDFFSNDSHNLTLTINDERGRTESAQLFLVAALYKSLKPIYSWGNSISKAKIQKDYVDLPVTNNGFIDYVFMETCVSALKKQCIARLKASDVFAHNRFEPTRIEHSKEVENNILVLDPSDVPTSERFSRFLPLYDIAVACGALVDEGVQSLGKNDVEMEGWIDVSEHIRKPNDQMFIVRAKGESMLPKIHPGDLCVFEVYGGSGNAGSREGQIVLTRQSRKDNDYNCQYTIKQYHSEKDPHTNRNTKIELRPLNINGYDPIVFNTDDDGEITVLGVLKDVIKL